MKKIFSLFVTLLFISYWVCTIIFTTPDNYVNINFLEYHSTFERFSIKNGDFLRHHHSLMNIYIIRIIQMAKIVLN